MNDVRAAFWGILGALVLGVALPIYILRLHCAASDDIQCANDYWRTQAVENCVHTAGCIYLAEDLLQYKLAKIRYEKNCQAYEAQRVSQTTSTEEGDDAAPVDSRHTST